MFSLLVEAKVIDPDGSIFRIARALNLTPAKTRTLLFAFQLRTVSETDADHAVMIALTTARYRKEGDSLAFGVHSPLIYAAIRAKMQEGGVFADVSLSGDILRVSPDQFGKVVASLITPAEAQRLIHQLGKQKIFNEQTLKAAIAKLVADLAKDAVQNGKDAAFKLIGDLILRGSGPGIAMLLAQL